MTVTLFLLLLYSVLQIGLGLWIGRRVRQGDDFFVAGHSLSAGLIFSTFLAANIGAGSTVGATALGYADGWSAWWRNGSAGLGSLALAFWIGPRIWREARTHGDLTVGDFLQRHYGPSMRRGVAALIWFGTLSILAGQLIGIAAVLQVAGGWPPYAGYLVGAIVAVTYFVAGGLLSSAWVNRVQLLFILAGFAIAVPAAVQGAGGWSQATSHTGTGFFGDDRVLGWRYIFILAPAFIVSPGLLQKAFGARDERAVRNGIALNGLVLLIFAFAPAILGLSARALFPDLAKPDLALPHADDQCTACRARRAGACGGLLGGGQHRGRRPVHARDVRIEGSLRQLHQSARDGCAARSRRSCGCHHRRLRWHRTRSSYSRR